MTAPLDDATSLVRGALAAHHWGTCPEEARLAPIRLLFGFVRAQREAGEIGKDELIAAGIEFNRMVLDSQGRRFNATVDEANACFKAGRALATVLATLSGEELVAAEGKVLDALTQASKGGTQ